MNPRSAATLATLVLALASSAGYAKAVPSQSVISAQAERIATIRTISQPTLAILDARGQGVGSGVMISPDGYALTNYHVSSACGTTLKCGMTDGNVYNAVIVGIDPTGDVSLIKMFGRDDFPAASFGDSDDVHPGDWAYVVGNPFLLADDFQPTVTYGIISGVHRYQYPAGTLLEYADCIQTDAAINPGNSGGPLFNSAGKLIGINGRGSFEKRGRVNVGVGYAISINQIQRFLGCLKSGRIVDHASMGATVVVGNTGQVVIDEILESSDAFRRGLRYDDEIVRFDGRLIDSANAFKNVLGTYPQHWQVPLTVRRDGREIDCLVRLSGYHRDGELEQLISRERTPTPRSDEPDEELPESPGIDPSAENAIPEVVAEHYMERSGFANYWFNQFHQERIWRAYSDRANCAAAEIPWQITGYLNSGPEVLILLDDVEGTIVLPAGESATDFTQPVLEFPSPPNSGGLLDALESWRRFMACGPQQYGDLCYLGTFPFSPCADLADCIVGNYRGAETRFYFDPHSGELLGLEFFARDDADPCEIHFSDFRAESGGELPYRWEVGHGDGVFAVIEVETYKTATQDARE